MPRPTVPLLRGLVALILAATTPWLLPASAHADSPGTFARTPAFSGAGQAAAVFLPGSVEDLERAAKVAGATGAWVQDGTGAFHLMLVGGPAFLKEGFSARFAGGFTTATPVTLTRPAGTAPARVFSLDPAALAATRTRLQAKDPLLAAASARLLRDADRAMRAGPFAVTDKTKPPPSGDLHDFASQSPYYWPDPAKADGLPYIYRDGEINPERDAIPDDRAFGSMTSNTESLSLAYYFTGDEKYAERAALLLRTWFIDPRTKMNPNLNYGQFVPGKNTGTPAGIIDTHVMPQVVDAIGLIEASPALTSDDRQALAAWFSAYRTWLTTAKLGLDEGKATNNHGTFYDAQVVSISLYLGDEARARTVLEAARERRIAAQIEPSGQQPRELARTKAWSYSVFNLDAMFNLAALGERAGVDLWNYESPDGRGMRRALDWLVPYALGSQPWTAQQITPFMPGELYPLLRRASVAYNSAAYRAAAARIAPTPADADRRMLTIPIAR